MPKLHLLVLLLVVLRGAEGVALPLLCPEADAAVVVPVALIDEASAWTEGDDSGTLDNEVSTFPR